MGCQEAFAIYYREGGVIILMDSHRAVFSLKGTNISLPSRYKIRKFRASKAKSQKPETQTQQEQLGLLIQAKDLPLHPKDIMYDQKSLQLNKLLDLPHCPNSSHTSPDAPSPLTPEPSRLFKLDIKNSQEVVCHASKPKQSYDHLSLLRRGRQHYSSMKAKRCSCGDCEDCLKDFAYYLQLFSEDQSVPEISAKSWCVWKKKNNKHQHYYGKRIHKVREIASLTKMVTAITAIDFLNRMNFNPEAVMYQVRKTSVVVGGTSGQLEEGQVLSILDLLYAMLLPSGNDAAIAVSEAVGLLTFLKGRGKQVNPHNHSQWYLPYRQKNYSYVFIGMMNERCQKLGTLDTRFFNSHGNDAYDQLKNISTCNEVARIASEFMLHYPLLREIVGTAHYKSWQNTNRLLEDGFDGIKTGITDTAGPCLAAAYKDYIIVVLHSKSMNERWVQVKKLVKWIMRKQ